MHGAKVKKVEYGLRLRHRVMMCEQTNRRTVDHNHIFR